VCNVARVGNPGVCPYWRRRVAPAPRNASQKILRFNAIAACSSNRRQVFCIAVQVTVCRWTGECRGNWRLPRLPHTGRGGIQVGLWSRAISLDQEFDAGKGPLSKTREGSDACSQSIRTECLAPLRERSGVLLLPRTPLSLTPVAPLTGGRGRWLSACAFRVCQRRRARQATWRDTLRVVQINDGSEPRWRKSLITLNSVTSKSVFHSKHAKCLAGDFAGDIQRHGLKPSQRGCYYPCAHGASVI